MKLQELSKENFNKLKYNLYYNSGIGLDDEYDNFFDVPDKYVFDKYNNTNLPKDIFEIDGDHQDDYVYLTIAYVDYIICSGQAENLTVDDMYEFSKRVVNNFMFSEEYHAHMSLLQSFYNWLEDKESE